MSGRVNTWGWTRTCKKCKRSKPMKGGAMVVGKGFTCAECRPPKKEAAQ